MAIRTADLGRRFGAHWALAHVDLEIERGEVVWIRGPNGAGKTTLLRILASLCRPTRGSVEILGLDLAVAREEVRSRLALVSHSLYLYPALTARETLELWRRLSPTSTADGSDTGSPFATQTLLEEVGLSRAADRRVVGFSAGMRKRLALARARLEQPQVLLLDEPFSALDQEGCEAVQRWVGRFADEGGTVVMASHDPERAAAVASLRLDFDRGQLVARERLQAAAGAGEAS